MLRPRTLGKIAIGVLVFCCLATAFLFALEVKNEATLYKGFRAVAYAVMGVAFAIVYRYFED
ncbi:MAG: hypothetical protein GXY85_08780 [Candidatus Brocadiaceae bacterium]|nr:hypothetical protein [Candidatus Brocadiaceae bacterium]